MWAGKVTVNGEEEGETLVITIKIGRRGSRVFVNGVERQFDNPLDAAVALECEATYLVRDLVGWGGMEVGVA